MAFQMAGLTGRVPSRRPNVGVLCAKRHDRLYRTDHSERPQIPRCQRARIFADFDELLTIQYHNHCLSNSANYSDCIFLLLLWAPENMSHPKRMSCRFIWGRESFTAGISVLAWFRIVLEILLKVYFQIYFYFVECNLRFFVQLDFGFISRNIIISLAFHS